LKLNAIIQSLNKAIDAREWHMAGDAEVKLCAWSARREIKVAVLFGRLLKYCRGMAVNGLVLVILEDGRYIIGADRAGISQRALRHPI
jgi:hypothetical protein